MPAVREARERSTVPLRLSRPGRDADRPPSPAPLSKSLPDNCLAGMTWQHPGPKKTKGPVAGALSGAFGVEVYGVEEGMKKKGSL